MKRIQMLKAAIVVVAIGGAFASKASTRQVITSFTLNHTGLPCTPIVHACGGTKFLCQQQVGTDIRYFHHEMGSNPCGKTLFQDTQP